MIVKEELFEGTDYKMKVRVTNHLYNEIYYLLSLDNCPFQSITKYIKYLVFNDLSSYKFIYELKDTYVNNSIDKIMYISEYINMDRYLYINICKDLYEVICNHIRVENDLYQSPANYIRALIIRDLRKRNPLFKVEVQFS